MTTSCVSTGTCGNTADCTFDVQDHQYGSSACAVTVVDNNGSSDSENITLTVNSVNDATTSSSVGDQSTDEDTDLTISVSSSDADLENYGEQHTFTLECDDASLVSTSCSSTGSNTADCTFDVQDHQYGSSACTVTVVDGNGSSDSEDITLTVNSVNDATTLSSVSDQSTDGHLYITDAV